MKPEYEPRDIPSALGYVTEEAGEVLQAIGKSQRWGLRSFNPELHYFSPNERGVCGTCGGFSDSRKHGERELNYVWIQRELNDLAGAIERAQRFLGVFHEQHGDAA